MSKEKTIFSFLFSNSKFLVALWLLLIIAFSIVVYLPGISGPFLFDTLVHLPKLGRFTEYSVWDRAFLIASAGKIDSPWLSRPLSFLTFLMNDPYWPVAAPSDFKMTNVLLHSLNALLVFWLLLRLTATRLSGAVNLNMTSVAILVAGCTALLWAVQPLQVSTVLYVVQRMTELSALFTLAVLISFLVGRTYSVRHPIAGYLIMTLGLICFGILGFLSKQTTVLVLLYILLIEFFLLRPSGVLVPRYFSIWLGLFVVLPVLLLVFYFAGQAEKFALAYEYRNFSLFERLLTEARILLDYLSLILIPRLHGTGLYHDDYLISTGLFSPWSTFISVLIIFFLISIAFYLRRRQPVLAFGILWFFAGHLLESTAIPIELYIEHRNYLPMLGPLYVVVYYGLTVAGRINKVTTFGVFSLIGMCLVLSSLNSLAWGNPQKLASIWLYENPASKRAINFQIHLMENRAEYDSALALLENAIDVDSQELSWRVIRVRYLCLANGVVPDKDIRETLEAIPNTRLDITVSNEMKVLFDQAVSDSCKGLTNEVMVDLLRGLLAHPQLRKSPYGQKIGTLGFNLSMLLSRAYVQRRDLNAAMASLDLAFTFIPYSSARIMQAGLLLSAGLYDDAWAYLEMAKKANEPDARRLTYFIDKGLPREFDDQIAVLERAIQHARDDKGTP